MVQFWITLQKLVQYNIKIIFGNKFLYFMLSALAFYVITVIVKLLGDDEITPGNSLLHVDVTEHSVGFLPDVFRHTERSGRQDRGNYFRNPEL